MPVRSKSDSSAKRKEAKTSDGEAPRDASRSWVPPPNKSDNASSLRDAINQFMKENKLENIPVMRPEKVMVDLTDTFFKQKKNSSADCMLYGISLAETTVYLLKTWKRRCS